MSEQELSPPKQPYSSASSFAQAGPIRPEERPLSPTQKRRRQGLLLAAYQLVNDESAEELSIQSIVKKAKTTRTTAYNYFANADELLCELCYQWFCRCLENIKNIYPPKNKNNTEQQNTLNHQLLDVDLSILISEMHRTPRMIAQLINVLSTHNRYTATQRYHMSLTRYLYGSPTPSLSKIYFHGSLVSLASGSSLEQALTILQTAESPNNNIEASVEAMLATTPAFPPSLFH